MEAIEQATGEREADRDRLLFGGHAARPHARLSAAKNGERRIAAASFFAALTDFKNPGELGVFIDEEQLAAMDQTMARRGFLEGREMATTFNMLRANDLIWSFVINNYLLGKEPFPFDLLYWNSDSTRMPYAMHSFYLHKFYRENRLVEPGGTALRGVPIDLCRIRAPVYMLSTREDHRAVDRDLRRDPAVPGRHQVRPGRIRAHRRGGQSAEPAEVRVLDQ